jgi:hypothetical protein
VENELNSFSDANDELQSSLLSPFCVQIQKALGLTARLEVADGHLGAGARVNPPLDQRNFLPSRLRPVLGWHMVVTIEGLPHAATDSLQRQYQRLRSSLASTGYISQGSVLDRSTLRPPRSGYQWTRKFARKTITVALSPEQFHSLRKAVQNRRSLQKTICQMEKLTRQILFGILPDTRRRKSLPKKALGLV